MPGRLAQIAILLAVGTTMFGLRPPTGRDRWLTFAWVVVLGVLACALLGIAVSAVQHTAKSAPAVVQMPFIVLQFISGCSSITTPAGAAAGRGGLPR